MRLTLFTDYSLRVLLVLATRTESLVTIADFSKVYGISNAHLMKVTHVLGKSGWVDTVRGRNGGMRLAMPPSKIMIGSVVRHLETDFALVECFGADNHCVLTGGCELAALLAKAMKAFLDELDRYSLADLAKGSPALMSLPLWQEITWQAPMKRPSIEVVPAVADALLSEPAPASPRKRARAALR